MSNISNKPQVGALGSGNAKGLSVSGNTLTLHAATSTQPGAASTAAQDFAGLKRCVDGLADVSYVGTNPEVGGSTPFQLTTAHKRVQVINPAGNIVVKLPTTGVLAGERLIIVNRSAFEVAIQSSGANAIETIAGGYIELVALVSTPTAAADWKSVDVYETGTFQTSFSMNASGNTTGNLTVTFTRFNTQVSLSFPPILATSNGSDVTMTSGADVPTRLQSSSQRSFMIMSTQNNIGLGSPAFFRMNTGGTFNLYKDSTASAAWTSSSNCGSQLRTELTYRL